MEKHYKPTERRMRRLKEEGNLARSPYITQTIVFFSVMLVVLAGLEQSWVRNQMLLEWLLSEGHVEPARGLNQAFVLCVKVVAGALGVGALAAVMVEFKQVGWLFEPGLLIPRASRLNPISGTIKIFSGLKLLWLFFLKLFAVFTVFFCFMHLQLGRIGGLIFLPGPERLEEAGRIFQSACWWTAAVVLPLALLDYRIRYRSWFKQAAMSAEDLRREHKEDEGDPLMRGARRAAHQELLMEDIVARVRKSRVIVVERADN